jgi:hypothetical protein
MEQPPKNPIAPLRKVFNVAERAIAARVEPLVQSGEFATAMSRYVAINRRVGRTVSKLTGGVLHLVNIPTTTDVARLHEHLNAVDRQLSLLTRELDTKRGSRQETPAGPRKSSRTPKEQIDTTSSEED